MQFADCFLTEVFVCIAIMHNKLTLLLLQLKGCYLVTVIIPTITYCSVFCQRMSNSKLLLISIGVGGLIGTGYAGFISITSRNNSSFTTQTKPAVIDKLPENLTITRKIYNPSDNTDLDLVLFQYQTCPFCCKVRTFPMEAIGLNSI